MKRLPIFDTFKTRGNLTGEARRQRAILAILSAQSSPMDRTRTAISKQIAWKSGKVWKNIYSGIFRDLDETLIPLEIVEEGGKLPLRRGPKALQAEGVPYYRLTLKGMAVCLSLPEAEGRKSMLQRVLAEGAAADGRMVGAFLRLERFAPGFAYSLIEGYVRAYCSGKRDDIFPITAGGLGDAAGVGAAIQRELLRGFTGESEDGKAEILELMDEMAR